MRRRRRRGRWPWRWRRNIFSAVTVKKVFLQSYAEESNVELQEKEGGLALGSQPFSFAFSRVQGPSEELGTLLQHCGLN